ncbi:Uncharacterized protein TCM_002588 [Theobroma cacao]|uniref:Uncharacterized protein n=1 Tax=Theobroma cacao TaxID=3641 RepID=A0A061DMR6_THECC|nr:Uncharacterized protein TCM_002588 [Theobroma cacao]
MLGTMVLDALILDEAFILGRRKNMTRFSKIFLQSLSSMVREISLSVGMILEARSLLVPPPAAEFKFDVDGSTKGKPGLVSFVTWKVSWWEYSLVLLIFKTQIIQDSWPFFCLAFFSTSPFVRTPLISESNSKIALTWIEKTEQRPWNKWLHVASLSGCF